MTNGVLTFPGVGSFTKPSTRAFPQTNHYARILHSLRPDHQGYAFPYDDVNPANADYSGKVQSGQPGTFTITVGS